MVGLFVLECNETAAEMAMVAAGNSTSSGFFSDLATSEYAWLVGVGCSVVSSIATAFGTVMQKKAHNAQSDAAPEDKSPEYMGIVFNKYWLFALIIMVAVPLPFDFASFALAPQSIIAPITGLTIVLSLLIAVRMLGEKVSRVEVIGTLLILLGVGMTTSTASGNPEEYSTCRLISRYGDYDVLTLFGLYFAASSLFFYWLRTESYPAYLEKFKPEFYAFIAGSMGGIMQVVFKATGAVAKGSAEGVGYNTWLTVYPYIFIVATVVLSLTMLSNLNMLLSRVDAVLATPLYFTNLIVFSSIAGLIYYEEYRAFALWQGIVFPFGVVIVCCGVMFMSLKGVDVDKLRAKEVELHATDESLTEVFKLVRAQSLDRISNKNRVSGNKEETRLRPSSSAGSASFVSTSGLSANAGSFDDSDRAHHPV